MPAVPLTLLSGFLGAGKTTLLQKILKNKEGIKCGVIVNDVASVNVDANVVSKDVKGEDTMVAMENGCVCCTLSEHFVEALVSLVESGTLDYILVESTGVADPENTAQPLIDPNITLADKGKLLDMVKLDTCVTVVDASMFFKYLYDGSLVCQEDHDHDDKEDCSSDALVCQLLASQIEYADIIVLNKTDLLPAKDLETVMKAVGGMNAQADVVQCAYGQVDLHKVLGTKKFNPSKFTGKVQSGDAPKKSNKDVEEAITHFVYTSRMPFHPERLHAFVIKHFHLRQRDWSEEMREHQSDALTTIRHASKAVSSAAKMISRDDSAVRNAVAILERAVESLADAVDDIEAEPVEEKRAGAPDLAAVEEPPAAAQAFGLLLRSKGQVWLAGPNRTDHLGEWSHSGNILQLTSGGPWATLLPIKYWPEEEDKRKEMLADFAPGIGDRRQELVFIGMGLAEEKLRQDLDACLCTPWEWLRLQQGEEEFADPFQKWPAIGALLPIDSDDEGEEEDGKEEEDEDQNDEMATTIELDQLMEGNDEERMIVDVA